ncbi:FMN-dependent NADH-azoreductase [Paenibacillus sp. FSL R10-2782]|uniref:FMN-dependent NADH-azoreductase n=1 Tax=Paenibacillus sp. FSL R10-2782 TaxID=2954661 RepID=UPI0031594AB7
MTTVLYITAHPLEASESYSLAVGKEFIDTYRAENPQDEIVHLDLFQMNIPTFDADIINALSKTRAGVTMDQLTEGERTKFTRIHEICDQFVAADKYVFASPMWNLTLPAVLFNYINSLCLAGKTYRYTEHGQVGLLENKKAVHIQASGGMYSEGPASSLESGQSYLRKILGFIGITSFEGILVEGMHYTPERAGDIKNEAIAKAKEAAKQF